MKLTGLLLVGAGGFAGAIARYLVGVLLGPRQGRDWPWATFVINVVGCALIGLFFGLASARPALPDGWRLLFPIGFVGAFTTFSTYAFETVQLVEAGAFGRAAAYVALSTLLGYGAVLVAFAGARRL